MPLIETHALGGRAQYVPWSQEKSIFVPLQVSACAADSAGSLTDTSLFHFEPSRNALQPRRIVRDQAIPIHFLWKLPSCSNSPPVLHSRYRYTVVKRICIPINVM